MPNAQRAVWRQAGCLLADTVVVIWKLTARPNLSEPPPERQAAGRYSAIRYAPCAISGCPLRLLTCLPLRGLRISTA